MLAHHLRHRGDERIGIAGLEAHQHGEQRLVGDDSGEDLDVLDLAGHDRLGDAGLFQYGDRFPELAERHPVHGGGPGAARGRFVDLGKRLFLDRHDRHVVAHAAGAIENEEREAPVSGNEADPHQSSATISSRRVARRRTTPRFELLMNCTR
jgi:hypothetical protein